MPPKVFGSFRSNRKVSISRFANFASVDRNTLTCYVAAICDMFREDEKQHLMKDSNKAVDKSNEMASNREGLYFALDSMVSEG